MNPNQLNYVNALVAQDEFRGEARESRRRTGLSLPRVERTTSRVLDLFRRR